MTPAPASAAKRAATQQPDSRQPSLTPFNAYARWRDCTSVSDSAEAEACGAKASEFLARTTDPARRRDSRRAFGARVPCSDVLGAVNVDASDAACRRPCRRQQIGLPLQKPESRRGHRLQFASLLAVLSQ